ncbi:hypothetical protein EBR96_04810 [bacterium]|nr:hypothetical protein [bacterium]
MINQHPVLSKGYLTGPLPAQSGESSPGMMPLTEFLVTDPIACSYFYLTRRSLSEALTGLGIFKPVGKPNVTDFDALILPLEKVANVLRKADPLSSEKECLTVVERYLMLAVIDLFSAPPASPGIESTRNNLRTRFAESMDTICSEGLKKIGPKILSRWVKATHSMPIPTPLIARILESLEDKVAARFLTIGAKTKAMKAFFGAAIAHNLNGVHRLIDLAAQAAPSLISEPLAYDLHALRIAARDPRPNAIVDRLIRVMPLEILFTKDPFQKSLIYRIIEDPRTSDVALIKIIDAVLAQNPRAVGIPINSYPDYERSWGDNLLMAAARFGRDQLVGHLMTQMDARAMRYRDSFGDTVFSVINGPRWAITERGWETSYENRFNRAFSIAVPYLRREPSGIPKSAKKLSFNRDRPLNFKHRHFVAFNLPDNPDRRMVYQVRMELFKNNVTRRMILADVRKLIGTGINKKLYSISE